jgi:hypothetical protein
VGSFPKLKDNFYVTKQGKEKPGQEKEIET